MREAAGAELERVREMLRGGKAADLKAQKLHQLGRQRRELEGLLGNTHQELANAMDDLEREKKRFDQLLQQAVAS